MNRCGDCQHARSVPENLTQRICKGAPPQIVIVPAAPGRLDIKHMWPTILAGDEGCSLFDSKPSIIDVTTGKVIDIEEQHTLKL